MNIACAPSIETFKSRLTEAISTGAIVVAPPRTVTTITSFYTYLYIILHIHVYLGFICTTKLLCNFLFVHSLLFRPIYYYNFSETIFFFYHYYLFLFLWSIHP